MKVVKNIFNIILSFALMLGIIASTLTHYTSRMLDKNYILSKFNEIDVYSQVLEEVKSSFKNYIYQSGMDETILDNIVTREKVEHDIKESVDALYAQKDMEIDTTEIEEKLTKEINDFIGKENRKISKEEETNIDNFKAEIIKSYKNSIGYFQITSKSIQEGLEKAVNTLEKAKNITKVATVFIFILIIVINIKTFSSAMNYISISLLSSGIVLLLINWLINSKIQIDNLLILVDSLSNAFITVIRATLDSIVSIGMWTVLFGIIGILFSAIKKMDKR